MGEKRKIIFNFKGISEHKGHKFLTLVAKLMLLFLV